MCCWLGDHCYCRGYFSNDVFSDLCLLLIVFRCFVNFRLSFFLGIFNHLDSLILGLRDLIILEAHLLGNLMCNLSLRVSLQFGLLSFKLGFRSSLLDLLFLFEELYFRIRVFRYTTNSTIGSSAYCSI